MGLMWFGTNDGLKQVIMAINLLFIIIALLIPLRLLIMKLIVCMKIQNKDYGSVHKYSGIDIYDRQHLIFIHLPHSNENGLSGNTIVSINEDTTGAFWIATDKE